MEYSAKLARAVFFWNLHLCPRFSLLIECNVDRRLAVFNSRTLDVIIIIIIVNIIISIIIIVM